ncbi:uncharacterized protein TrAFT101_012058 [Trichoderma asperellum]|uniref:uncharacterized protein n=1 Tax=Trichoderma asperellum TaxID=101201 RepID=UPI003333606D|nr:hypothetical protein TrAFT101_012058 [Trichoderma asperellum]
MYSLHNIRETGSTIEFVIMPPFNRILCNRYMVNKKKKTPYAALAENLVPSPTLSFASAVTRSHPLRACTNLQKSNVFHTAHSLLNKRRRKRKRKEVFTLKKGKVYGKKNKKELTENESVSLVQ